MGKPNKISLADMIAASLPSEEEFAERSRKQEEDRASRSRQDLFNPLNLGHWIDLCERAGVPSVPAEEIARARVGDLLCFDQAAYRSAVGAFEAAVTTAMAKRGDRWMVRWSCCSGSEVKHRLSEGQPSWHQDMVAYFSIGDPRAYEIVFEYPEETVAAYARPWVDADIINGFPVEYRVYVADNDIIAISNYYPQRDLPNNSVRLSDIAKCYEYSRSLLAAQSKRLNAPRLEAHWDVTQNQWTADFIRLTDGSIVFLEGGPPFTPNGGGHPCCFLGRPVEGIALAASDEGRQAMGLLPAGRAALRTASEGGGDA